jgi:hypothetical protein
MPRDVITPGVSSVEEMMARAKDRQRRMWGDLGNHVPVERVRPPEPWVRTQPKPPKPRPQKTASELPILTKPFATLPDVSRPPAGFTPRERIRWIIETTARVYDVAYSDIMSESRVSRVSTARRVAVYLVAREFVDLTLPRLGEIFVRDHTTMQHAIVDMDEVYGTDVAGLRREARRG